MSGFLLNPFLFTTETPATGKAYFDGTTDYLSVADSDDWYMGTGNFCVEMLLNFTSISTTTLMYLFGQYADSSNYWFLRKNDDDGLMWRLTVRTGGSTVIQFIAGANNTIPTSGVETHFALVRNGTSNKLYIGGVNVVSLTDADAFPNISAPFTIGASATVTTNTFNGKMGGVRITKGDARYTADFTPPTAFTNDSANVKLCLRFAEAIGSTTFIDDTGKTVTTNGNVVIVA